MMEKGSFHHNSAPSPIVQSADEAVKKIPLPNQLPKGIDFAEIPVGTLKSSTLESLIDQNEDLMARLSVSLRRANEFEDRIHHLEKENSALRSRFEALKEQFLLVQEKDKISTTRNLQLHEEGATYKRHSEKLEKAYSDLFVQAQAFQSRMVRLERHQARLRKAARTMQKRSKQATQLLAELDHSAVTHQQSVQSYEVKLADVRSEIESMRSKVQERDRIYAEKVKLENELVFERRQGEMYRQETDATLERLQSENTSMRVQVKQALVNQEAQRQEIERLNADVPHLRAEQQRLIEQVESLQALWSHKQKELEGSEEKNKALQKLNQSISLTLNQQRKEIHNLEQEVEKERFTSAEKIKQLIAEIQMLRQKMNDTKD